MRPSRQATAGCRATVLALIAATVAACVGDPPDVGAVRRELAAQMSVERSVRCREGLDLPYPSIVEPGYQGADARFNRWLSVELRPDAELRHLVEPAGPSSNGRFAGFVGLKAPASDSFAVLVESPVAVDLVAADGNRRVDPILETSARVCGKAVRAVFFEMQRDKRYVVQVRGSDDRVIRLALQRLY